MIVLHNRTVREFFSQRDGEQDFVENAQNCCCRRHRRKKIITCLIDEISGETTVKKKKCQTPRSKMIPGKR